MYCPCSDDPISRLICSHLYVSIARRSHRVFVCARGSSALVLFVEINRIVPANVKGKEQQKVAQDCVVLCVRRSIFFFQDIQWRLCVPRRVVRATRPHRIIARRHTRCDDARSGDQTWTFALLPDFPLSGKPLRSHTLGSFSRSKEQAPTPA